MKDRRQAKRRCTQKRFHFLIVNARGKPSDSRNQWLEVQVRGPQRDRTQKVLLCVGYVVSCKQLSVAY